MKKRFLKYFLFVFLMIFAGYFNLTGSNDFNSANSCLIECNEEKVRCPDPIKYLGKKDGCSCYTCNYGKRNQFTVCVKSGSNASKDLSERTTDPREENPRDRDNNSDRKREPDNDPPREKERERGRP